MELKVGPRQVVQTVRLLLPPGEEGFIAFQVRDFHAKLRIVFSKSSAAAPTQRIEVGVDGDIATITFVDWLNSLGTATVKPILLAKLSNGQAMHFMAAHWGVGEMNCLDMQFLLVEAQ